MVKETNTRLASELQWGLREMNAPPELWDRVQAGRFAPRRKTSSVLIWATAAVGVLFAIGVYRTTTPGDLPHAGIRCQNPAQLRAWVRAKTGIDVPLRAATLSSIQLIGARSVAESVEIAYRTGDRGGSTDRIAGHRRRRRAARSRERQRVFVGYGWPALYADVRQRGRPAAGLQALPSGLVGGPGELQRLESSCCAPPRFPPRRSPGALAERPHRTAEQR